MRKLAAILLIFTVLTFPPRVVAKEKYWDVQSIDTMKFSRDLAREKLNDKNFEKVINEQVKNIAETGATHVAVGTPYDEEFLPYLQEWVKAARVNNLNVWFRGNWSGWEGWFGYGKITPEEHLTKTKQFILLNQSLFEDGDIFTSCTECENGGPGDPRRTGDVKGFRQFLTEEYKEASRAFEKIGKKVSTSYFSMNADVAMLVMNKVTTDDLGGIVVIDHYTKTPEKLASDIKKLADASGGKVVLGEIGVPIPDIHGAMAADEQAEWLRKALVLLSNEPALAGVNYWVANGGTTALWEPDGQRRPAVDSITGYYSPKSISGKIVNELGRPIKDAQVTGNVKTVSSDKNGNFALPSPPSLNEIAVNAKGYNERIVDVKKAGDLGEIVLKRTYESLFFKIQKYLYQFFTKITFSSS